MQKLLSAAEKSLSHDGKPNWGDINGVRLTKVDEVQQYANDSLATVLENQDSGRHVARVAHLYFARMSTLTQADLEVHLLTLMKKMFGPSPTLPTDSGWMGSDNITGMPHSVADELKRDLDSTFDDQKWNAEQLKLFRMFQLLYPFEKENLFKVVYCRKITQFQYFFPISDLPPRTAKVLNIWKSGKSAVVVPQLYVTLCGSPPRIIEGYLQLDLCDWFTIRFLNWFVGTGLPQTKAVVISGSLFQNVESKTKTVRKLSLNSLSVADVTAGNPALELLLSYFTVFLPYERTSGAKVKSSEEISPRMCAVFRWSISDLWLNRVKVIPEDPPVSLPSRRLMESLFLLVTHFSSDPSLVVEDESAPNEPPKVSLALASFRAYFYRFFTYSLNECPFDSQVSFDTVVDLLAIYLSPWRANYRTKRKVERSSANRENDFSIRWVWFVVHNYFLYVNMLHLALERLDEESNATVDALVSVANLFCGTNEGAFSLAVLGTIFECESIWFEEEPLISKAFVSAEVSAASAEYVKTIHENKSLVLKALRTQHEELEKPSVKYISSLGPKLTGFVRELRHKEKHSSPAIPMLSSTPLKDISDRLCRIFNLELEVMEGPSQLRSAVDALGHPEFLWKAGVPKWFTQSGGRARFRALTEKGKQQLRSGEREGGPDLAAQYIGDFSVRPVETAEIPVLVHLAIVLNESIAKRSGLNINVRPFADARNILWCLIFFAILDFIKLRAGYTLWIASIAIYCVGAGFFRDYAEKLWNALFAGIWMYSYWQKSL